MARIELDGMFKHAPLTEDQIGSSQNRNLDREVVIHTDSQSSLVLGSDTSTLSNYILSYEYATGGGPGTVRRNVATLELLKDFM